MVWIPRRRRERCSTIMLARASPAPRGHVRVGVCVSVLECRGLRGAGSSIKYHCIDLCSFFRERERCRVTLTVTAGCSCRLCLRVLGATAPHGPQCRVHACNISPGIRNWSREVESNIWDLPFVQRILDYALWILYRYPAATKL